MRKYLIPLILFVFILPAVSIAQDAGISSETGGIVPCNGPDCNLCHVVELGQNILLWLISIIAAIIALVFVIGGLKMVINSTNEAEITKAKKMMTNAIIGFIILLASWLIVDTILKVFIIGNPAAEGPTELNGYGPWNQIECVAQPTAAGTTPQPSDEVPQGACTNCVVIPSTINVKNTACSGTDPCTVSSLMAANLVQLDQRLEGSGVNWQVTEAYPPTVTHQNQCHYNGTCVDANCIGGCSASQITTFYTAATASGLSPVYEVNSSAQRDALIAEGVPPNAVIVVSAITAPHFSVYGG